MKKGRSGKDMTVSLIFPERQTIPTQPATGSVVLGGDEEVSRGIGRRSLQNPADSVCPDSQDKEAQTADDSNKPILSTTLLHLPLLHLILQRESDRIWSCGSRPEIEYGLPMTGSLSKMRFLPLSKTNLRASEQKTPFCMN